MDFIAILRYGGDGLPFDAVHALEDNSPVELRDFRLLLKVPARFEDARDFSQGFAAVKLDGKWGFIDETGEYIVPPCYSDAREFSSGFAAVLDRKWGYINKQGEPVVPCQFDDALAFLHGVARIKLGRRWGYINQP